MKARDRAAWLIKASAIRFCKYPVRDVARDLRIFNTDDDRDAQFRCVNHVDIDVGRG